MHQLYRTVYGRDKDYISFEKDNRYRGVHLTVYSPVDNKTMIQLQLKTPKMYKINAYGITAYWDYCNDHNINKPGEVLQDEVRKMPFYRTLVDLSQSGLPDEEYNKIVKSDILTNMVYLRNVNGKKLELPSGSTPVDFAFNIDPERAPFIESALVNGRLVPINCQLESRDEIEIIYSDEMRNPIDLENNCRCLQTKRKIRSI